MNISIGADHRGSDVTLRLAQFLTEQGHTVTRFGSTDGEPCDYPEAAYQVGSAVASGSADRGVLVCGTGIGMSIAANKVAGIRAAVVQDELTAHLARGHNDANIVCLSADLLGERAMEKIVEVFLRDEFEGGRHARRISKINAIEAGAEPSSVTT
jgi:ribose 5-phosphate isomerase B